MKKDILEGVMIYVINEIKPNYAAAKQYDCDYRTVKHAYEEVQDNLDRKDEQTNWVKKVMIKGDIID